MESIVSQPTSSFYLRDETDLTEEVKFDHNNLSYLRDLFDKNLTDFYNLFSKNLFTVFNIFNDFYGEDRVDIQNLMSVEDFKYLVYNSYIESDIFKSRDIIHKLYDIRCSSGVYDPLLVHDIFTKDLYKEVAQILVSYKAEDLGYWIGESHILDNHPISIIVHFPKVRITNEDGKYTDAENFYVKVNIDYSGKMVNRFLITRSTFSFLHYDNCYTHSHCPGLPSEREFLVPCLGSGPILNTVNNLNIGFDETLWVLFCRELDLYLRTESKAGVPYQYLERLTLSGDKAVNEFNIDKHYLSISNRLPLDKFVTYLLSLNVLKFTYVHGNYSIGMSYKEYAICVSNVFIDWINKNKDNEEFLYTDYSTLIRNGIINSRTIINDSFYYPRHSFSVEGVSDFTNKIALTFKGKDIYFSITDFNSNNICTVTLLNHMYLMGILYKILFILNYEYRKQRNTEISVPIKEKNLYL